MTYNMSIPLTWSQFCISPDKVTLEYGNSTSVLVKKPITQKIAAGKYPTIKIFHMAGCL